MPAYVFLCFFLPIYKTWKLGSFALWYMVKVFSSFIFWLQRGINNTLKVTAGWNLNNQMIQEVTAFKTWFLVHFSVSIAFTKERKGKISLSSALGRMKNVICQGYLKNKRFLPLSELWDFFAQHFQRRLQIGFWK